LFLTAQARLVHSTELKRCERVGALSREELGLNATVKTGVAMSIVVAGAIAIYASFNQDSWWYGSGLAMAWGAAVSWVRNLV
jgi:hypothetical protein